MQASDQIASFGGPVGWIGNGLIKTRNAIRRNYNLLIDICFWIQFYVQGKALLQDFRILPEPLYSQSDFGQFLYRLQLTLEYPSGWILIFLLAFSSFRDEFCERIWARAATSFAKFLVLFPTIWYGILLTFLPWSNEELVKFMLPNLLPPHMELVPNLENIGMIQLQAMNFMLMEIVLVLPVLLAGFYKWNRWRSGN
ncbi:hypothetical protein [Novosphingobium sp.]|uniref:hypothetical protein n=1 Tax=Novosphingobium sp. TaxID=1874826 RepID=UPI0025EF0A63|nr:hypothetical protein [Novosphingobium sp.]MCC6926923.1 hypothetical protein [Novosphingobium sp.]